LSNREDKRTKCAPIRLSLRKYGLVHRPIPCHPKGHALTPLVDVQWTVSACFGR